MTKHIITAIICAVFIQFSFSQTTINRTAGVTYTNGVPTADPGARGSLIVVDITTWREYEWNAGSSTWVHRGFFIQEISGCTAPAFTPGLHDSYYQKSIGCKSLWIWNGTSWDLSGDDWGDQTINTLSPLSGKGTSGDPLTIGQAGATNGQVLKWNSTTSAWEPANDNNTGTTYTAGTGINVTGSVISNTGDLSNTNELQTLSTGTNTLTLSNSGGTVTVDTDPTDDVTGSGSQGLVAYWSATKNIVHSPTINLLYGYIDASNGSFLLIPTRTSLIGAGGAIYRRTDRSNLPMYCVSSGRERPFLLGSEFQSNAQASLTGSVVENPDLYGLMHGTDGTRWSVVNSGTTASGGTYVRTYTINPNILSNPASGGITYTQGSLYFGFYYNRIPQAISVRYMAANGTWYGPYSVDMTNVNSAQDNSWPLYSLKNPTFNFLAKIEVTITNPVAAPLMWVFFDYISSTDISDIINPYKYIDLSRPKNQIGTRLEWINSTTPVMSLGNNGPNYVNTFDGNGRVLAVGSNAGANLTSLTAVNQYNDGGTTYGLKVMNIAGANVIAARGDKKIGFGHDAPTSLIDIDGDNGYTQLRLRDTYTPTSSADVNGQNGDICIGADGNFYFKTGGQWRKLTSTTF